MIITFTDFSKDVLRDIDYINNIAVNDTRNRQPQNYVGDLLLQNHQIAVTIAYNDSGEPYSISSIMDRPCYNGMARVASRFYFNATGAIKGLKNPDMNMKHICRPSTVEMIDQQTTLAHEIGFDNVFLSREDKRPLRFKGVHRGIVEQSKFSGWEFNETQQYIVHPGTNPYQWVIYLGNNLLNF